MHPAARARAWSIAMGSDCMVVRDAANHFFWKKESVIIANGNVGTLGRGGTPEANLSRTD